MSKNDKPTHPRSREQKGYQPKPFAGGHKTHVQGGYQPTSQGAPAKPPSKPPKEKGTGKK